MRLLSDLEGLILVLLTWILFFFTHRVTVTYILLPWFGSDEPAISLPGISLSKLGSVAYIIFCMAVILAVVSHSRAVFSDPGSLAIAPVSPPPTLRNPRICKLCGGRWKPPRAHHCRKCKTCVFRMDHHCPWINNCVGLFNQKFFILFLIYTVAACGFNLFLLGCSAGAWLFYASEIGYSLTLKSTLLLAANVLVSCFFLFMALDFFSEQCEALVSNSTLVESYQSIHGVKMDTFSHIRQIFGDDFFFYPLPTRPYIQVHFEEPVMLDAAVANRIVDKRKRLSLKGGELGASKSGSRGGQGTMRHMESSSSRNQSKIANGGDCGRYGWTASSAAFADRQENMRKRLPSQVCHSSETIADNYIADRNYDNANEHMGRGKNKTPSAVQCILGGFSAGEMSKSASTPNVASMYFVNKYVRPKEDIGVDIDASDEAHFVRDESGSKGSNPFDADELDEDIDIDIPWASMHYWNEGKITNTKFLSEDLSLSSAATSPASPSVDSSPATTRPQQTAEAARSSEAPLRPHSVQMVSPRPVSKIRHHQPPPASVSAALDSGSPPQSNGLSVPLHVGLPGAANTTLGSSS